jgi:hypothetical protein
VGNIHENLFTAERAEVAEKAKKNVLPPFPSALVAISAVNPVYYSFLMSVRRI